MRPSDRHEAELAAALPRGVRVLASGAKLDRYDVRTAAADEGGDWRFRLECKCTQRGSLGFKRDDWLALREYAALRGERPAWGVRFYEAGDPERAEPLADVVAIDLNDFIEMLYELDCLRANRVGGKPRRS